jgi:hypothetical protein
MARSNKNWSFSRGVVVNAKNAFFTSFLEEEEEGGVPQEVTQVIRWNPDQVANFMLPWQAKDICFSLHPQLHAVMVDPFGNVRVSGPAGNADEIIDPSDDGPTGRGPLRELRTIGEHIYAVGMHRQCYRRDCGSSYLTNGKWIHMDEGVAQPRSSGDITGFNSIDGFSEDDIYAAGWQGEIWHYSRKKWKKCNSGTNLKFERVICGEDGKVYAVGQVGTIVRGRENTWEIVEQEATTGQFWGATWYQNRLWLATDKKVFALNADDSLEEAELPVKGSVTSGWLIAGEGVLWSVGPYHLFSTSNGKIWKQVFIGKA